MANTRKIIITKNSNIYKGIEDLKLMLKIEKERWGCEEVSILLNDSTKTTASTNKLLLTISD